MSKNLKRYFFIIFSILLIISFLILGFWQLKRKSYKEDLINRIKAQMKLDEVEYRNNIENKIYRHFKFTGKFDNEKKLYVYGSNSHKETNGYFILTPFIMDNGKKIIVVRGWTKDRMQTFNLAHKDDLSGIIINSDKPGRFTPRADLSNKLFYSFDVEKMAEYLSIDLENFFVIEANNKNLVKTNVNKFITIYNKHIEYIFTWFTLAIFTFIIFITNLKKL